MSKPKTTEERVLRLAAKGEAPEVIAARLLLSFQRVARIIAEHGVPPAIPAPEPAPPVQEQVPLEEGKPENNQLDEVPLPVIIGPELTNPMEKLLVGYLLRAAEGKVPCPSNDCIGRHLSRTGSWVRDALRTLNEDGHIRIERKGPCRRIRIGPNGLWTGWSRHPRGAARFDSAIQPPLFDTSVIDLARRHLMSRDHVILTAGPGLFKVNNRVRTTDELIAMANRSLAALGRPMLSEVGGQSREDVA